MNLNSRVKELIAAKGIGQVELAKKVGLPASTLSKVTTGKSEPNYKFFNHILNYYPDINARWLMTGEGEMFLNEENTVGATKEEIKSPDPEITPKQEESVFQMWMVDKAKIDDLYQENKELREMFSRKDERLAFTEQELKVKTEELAKLKEQFDQKVAEVGKNTARIESLEEERGRILAKLSQFTDISEFEPKFGT